MLSETGNLMKLLQRATTVVGWTFILATSVILVRPGGLLREEFDEWRQAVNTRNLINRQWEDIATGSTVLGSNTTTQRIVEFIDYQCSYCRIFHHTLTAFLKTHAEVGVLVRQLPHPARPKSRLAALAAICAERQGRFDAMHTYLLTDTTWMSHQDWARVAREAGLQDSDAFVDCTVSNEAQSVLAADSAWAAQLSLRATPALLSKGQDMHLGVASAAVMAEWLGLAEH